MTPEQRVLRSRLGAHSKWAACEDRAAATAPARKGWRARFEQQADPEGVLSPEELQARTDQLIKAHMTRMALKSSLSRAKKKRGAA